MAKKKETLKAKFRKDVVIPINSVKEMLKQNTTNDEIDIHNHITYEDGTQSVNITIHYTPNELTNN